MKQLQKAGTWLGHASYSRTMRFAALMSALMALEGMFSLLQPHLPVNVFAVSSVVLTVGLAYYRSITTQPMISK